MNISERRDLDVDIHIGGIRSIKPPNFRDSAICNGIHFFTSGIGNINASMKVGLRFRLSNLSQCANDGKWTCLRSFNHYRPSISREKTTSKHYKCAIEKQFCGSHTSLLLNALRLIWDELFPNSFGQSQRLPLLLRLKYGPIQHRRLLIIYSSNLFLTLQPRNLWRKF